MYIYKYLILNIILKLILLNKLFIQFSFDIIKYYLNSRIN